MDVFTIKAIQLLQKKYSLELLTSGEDRVLQTLINYPELKLELLGACTSHPATMYAVLSNLQSLSFITLNRKASVAIIDLDRLRGAKQ